jgi:hypothetical protein
MDQPIHFSTDFPVQKLPLLFLLLCVTALDLSSLASMPSRSRKRLRLNVGEDYTFKATIILELPASQRKTKRQKLDKREHNKCVMIQKAPFLPAGQFKTYDSMDLQYKVDPEWLEMTRYNCFVRKSAAIPHQDTRLR